MIAGVVDASLGFAAVCWQRSAVELERDYGADEIAANVPRRFLSDGQLRRIETAYLLGGHYDRTAFALDLRTTIWYNARVSIGERT